jgi:hypothetical protein
LLVPEPPPESFTAYLAALGFRPPRFRPEPRGPEAGAHRPERTPKKAFLFTPFGWSEEAFRRNANYEIPAVAPSFEVVKRVNSRAFGMALERELFPAEVCPAVFGQNGHEIEAWLRHAEPGDYVAKGNHGSAGIGQLRIRLPGNSMRLFRALERLRARMDGVAIERMQAITAEFGVLFRLARDGSISPRRVHRLLSGSEGGYAGALVTPQGQGDPAFLPWREKAEAAVRAIAAALHREGYYGPVGIDMYAWEGASAQRFRPLADLNARCSMAWPAHGLARRFPDRAVCVAQVSASALEVPEAYAKMSQVAKGSQFDLKTRRGFIWLTPLLSLPRHSLAFIGNETEDTLQLRALTLDRFARGHFR